MTLNGVGTWRKWCAHIDGKSWSVVRGLKQRCSNRRQVGLESEKGLPTYYEVYSL